MSQNMGLWLSCLVNKTPDLCFLSQVRQLHLSGQEPSSPLNSCSPHLASFRQQVHLTFQSIKNLVASHHARGSPSVPSAPALTCCPMACAPPGWTLSLLPSKCILESEPRLSPRPQVPHAWASHLHLAPQGPCAHRPPALPPQCLCTLGATAPLPPLPPPPTVRPTLTLPSSPPCPPWTYLPSQGKSSASP